MFEITRQIGIDAGHRIPNHLSKCRNVHGHRYEIMATCRSDELVEGGNEEGMVMDFSFLKEEMMCAIDECCDHSFIISSEDKSMINTFGVSLSDVINVRNTGEGQLVDNEIKNKVYMIPFSPTAENLAKHWYGLLAKQIKKRTNGLAWLHKIVVYETPNSSATYPQKNEISTRPI